MLARKVGLAPQPSGTPGPLPPPGVPGPGPICTYAHNGSHTSPVGAYAEVTGQYSGGRGPLAVPDPEMWPTAAVDTMVTAAVSAR